MNRLLVCAGFAAGIASGAVGAQDVLQSKGCLSCHDMERRKVGPAFKDVGAKYKGDKSKAGDIVARMKEGKGHPKVAGSDAELRAAVEAALSSR
jgi:cytochrome c